MEIDVKKHILVPKHSKLSPEKAEEMLNKHNVKKSQIPIILKSDPAIQDLDAEKDDIIEIERDSPTIGKSYYYRVVI